MAIAWTQIEGGVQLREKIEAYAKPRFLKIEKYNPVAKQTNFILSFYPTDEAVRLSINGLTYYENVHFSVNRKSIPPTFTWLATARNNGFDLAPTDEVYVEYWSFSRF